MLHFSGVTFSLKGDSIPTNGSGRVRITTIGDSNEDALICRSEMPTSVNGDWYLHPSQLTTDDDYNIESDPRWSRNRATDSEGHQLVRLRRATATAVEGVFTCHIPGDNNTPRTLGIYYPSELCIIIQSLQVLQYWTSVHCGLSINYKQIVDIHLSSYKTV